MLRAYRLKSAAIKFEVDDEGVALTRFERGGAAVDGIDDMLHR
jgi:hypothetical protein